MKPIILMILLMVACSEETLIVPEPVHICDECFRCPKGAERVADTDSTDVLTIKICDGGVIEYWAGSCGEYRGESVLADLLDDGQPKVYSAVVVSGVPVTVTISDGGVIRNWVCVPPIPSPRVFPRRKLVSVRNVEMRPARLADTDSVEPD